MELKPVFDYLVNTEISNTGFEYFPLNEKVIALAHLINKTEKQSQTYGFLFDQVYSMRLLAKTQNNADNIGCKDIGMLHYIYSRPIDESDNEFVMHTNDDFIILRAKRVKLVEGLVFM